MSFRDYSSRYCTQIPIAEAVGYLLSKPRKFEYHEQYRAIEPDEAMAQLGLNEFQQLVLSSKEYHAVVSHLVVRGKSRVRRSDAPTLTMKPFQRYCIVPDAWRDMARDQMIEREAKHVFEQR